MNNDRLELIMLIKEGQRPFSDLVVEVGDHKNALIIYAEAMKTKFGPRVIEGQCEACLQKKASHQKTYFWRAVLSYQALKNMKRAAFLIPVLLFFNFISPLNASFDGLFKFKDIQFETMHNLCHDCHRRINRNGKLGYALMFILGIPLVIAFCALVFTSIFVILCAFHAYGFSPEDFAYGLPALLMTLTSVAALKFGVTRVPVLMTTPSPILKIEQGCFQAFNVKGAGNITG